MTALLLRAETRERMLKSLDWAIAEQTEKTDVAVRVLLSRCIRQLETLLQDVKPTR